MHSAKHDLFNQIVMDGILAKAGMVSFAGVLSQPDADAIHAYIIEQAQRNEELKAMPDWLKNSKQWLYESIAKLIVKLI